jgi:hypothetical protein
MQKSMKLALVAALACGGIRLFAAPADAANHDATSQPSNTPPPKPPALPTGVKEISNTLSGAMTGVLKSATQNGVEPGNFDEMINTLVDVERDRIGAFKDKKFTDLDEQTRKFQKTWREKYKRRFEIDSTQTFADASGAQGLVETAKQAQSKWPVSAQSGASKPAAAPKPPHRASRGRKGQKKIPTRTPTYGPQVGVVHLPKAGDAPGLFVSMADEAGGWKIVIPSGRTGQQIHDDLLKKLSALNDDPQKWPDNRIDAGRMVVNNVLSALYGAGK